jgi:hypothetical protein
MGSLAPVRLAALSFIIIGATAPALAGEQTEAAAATLTVPKIDLAPQLEDFLGMEPAAEWRGRLAHVDQFIQRAPDDGAPGTERTSVYVGYDTSRLYVIFVAFDREPQKIRARLDRRESITLDEDAVGFYIDTFDDGRRAYQFECNALGVQDDSVYSEDTATYDGSFDTVWDSRGALTEHGFVVWMAIPFKSLRFHPASEQRWRFAAWRWIARRSEGAWWPRETFRIRGILSQAARLSGVTQIAPARNMQFVPYATWRAYETIDGRGAAPPAFVTDFADAKAGVDSKFVLNDSLVLDVTANPDFAQVESDEPQSVVNQRFEVFFPERRPFFTENASYFEAPLVNPNDRFLFTRRIADPQLGVRLTGTAGRNSIGFVAADDRSPGEQAAAGSPLAGTRAYFMAGRVSRDLGRQSSIGAMYTDRSYEGGYSRLVSGDAIARLSRTWSATFVAAESFNRTLGGAATSGRDVETAVRRDGRTFNYSLRWIDRARDFHTDVGFIPRVDERLVQQVASYTAYSARRWLNDVKAEIVIDKAWDSRNREIFAHALPTMTIDFRDPTTVTAYHHVWYDVLRPEDYGALPAGAKYDEHLTGFTIDSRHFRFMGISSRIDFGDWINYVPAAGAAPVIARSIHGEATVAFRPAGRLQIANGYLLDESADAATIFSANVFRSKWSWQLTREWSVRVIGQYNSVETNPLLISQVPVRRLNADVLLTYLLHPGTALYVGYNTDHLRIAPGEPLTNDGRQFFVKMSYLFRP